MASLISIIKVGEQVDGRNYPEGEVCLALTMKEAAFLRAIMNTLTGYDDFRGLDMAIWRGVSHKDIPRPPLDYGFIGPAQFGKLERKK